MGNKTLIARELRKNMTSSENYFWKMVRNRKLYNLKFKRQHVISGFIIDFYCHELKLCVEIDGSVHEDKDQMEYDQNRDKILIFMGYRILRFKNEDVISNKKFILKCIRDLV